MKKNWEEIMCLRNEKMKKRKDKIESIRKETEALITEEDLNKHKKQIQHIFPEIKNDTTMTGFYQKKFYNQFITSKIEEKLGEDTKNQYDKLVRLNDKDDLTNQRVLKSHRIK